MKVESDISALKTIVRIGKVSSVDVEKNMARVIFPEYNDMVSGWLKVLKNQPLITIEKWVEEEGKENKWEYEAEYASVDRNLGLEESYSTNTPDIIKNEKVIKYEKRKALEPPLYNDCTLEGVIEEKKHKQIVTVYPWLPYIGQIVICLYLPNGESDGFVIGGI